MNNNLREYGDVGRVKEDAKVLRDIFDRQGSKFINDVMADIIGESCLKFKVSHESSKIVRDTILNDLKEAINERI